MRVELDEPLYYLRNFKLFIDWLSSRYEDLLSDVERGFIEQFQSQGRCSQALLVRMVMRKGTLFRQSKLRYAEIPSTPAAMAPLASRGWVDADPELSVDELFAVRRKAELIRHFGMTGRDLALRKAELLERLRPDHRVAKRLAAWAADPCDVIYRLLIADICERFRLVFFGNFRQDLTAFVLADLGVFRYEPVDLGDFYRPFQTRSQIEVFHQLYRCRQHLHAGAAPADIGAAMPDTVADCEWLEERRQRLRFQLAQAHEQAGELDSALAIYADCTEPGAVLRSTRLRNRIHRRRIRRPASAVPVMELEMARPVTDCRVEHLVRDALTERGAGATEVHYVENGLINSLFGLLCWRAIFAPVPGAFFHAFHHGPADLASELFYTRRAAVFEACLADLESGAYPDTMRRTFAEKAGVVSPFVAWGLLSSELLDTALLCFPPRHLRKWFEWVARDVRANRCGFPDLVQFWPAERRYELIEVKAPGDRLQDNQRRCLDYSLAHQLPVSVCRVRWASNAAR